MSHRDVAAYCDEHATMLKAWRVAVNPNFHMRCQICGQQATQVEVYTAQGADQPAENVQDNQTSV